MKAVLYTACCAHVIWRIVHWISKTMVRGMRFHFERKDAEFAVSKRMGRYWKSARFKNQVAAVKDIKLYRDIYAKPKYALLAFKGNKSNVKKRKKIR